MQKRRAVPCLCEEPLFSCRSPDMDSCGAKERSDLACAMRCLLRTIGADRHAAPAPRMAARLVGEQQRAGMAFAGFDIAEIFFADDAGHRFGDRQQQRFWRTPAPRALPAD